MVIFDETNNVHLSPFLGTNHDLLSANDTAVIRKFSTMKYKAYVKIIANFKIHFLIQNNFYFYI